MQQRWQQALDRYDEEKPLMQQEMQGARDRIRSRAEELKAKAQSEAASARGSGGARRRR